jgi:hypothetical protein
MTIKAHLILCLHLLQEEKKKETRREKERQNEEYGRRLKEQVDEIHRQKLLATDQNNLFAALENATVSPLLISLISGSLPSLSLTLTCSFRLSVQKIYKSNVCKML